ncbi:MAG: DUF5317 family protein [Tissierellia bacterium]|nr:DUF5317 family protein [Tissierellia bacterium]
MLIESILIALFLVYITNGQWKNLFQFQFKKIYLPITGILVFLFLQLFTSVDFGKITDFCINNFYYFHLLSILLIIIGLLFNLELRSMYVILLGFILNFIPLFVNGKMPVSIKALEKISNTKSYHIIMAGRSLSHGVFEHPKFFILSDIFPLPSPYYQPKIISVGDILIHLGIILIILEISRRKISGKNH